MRQQLIAKQRRIILFSNRLSALLVYYLFLTTTYLYFPIHSVMEDSTKASKMRDVDRKLWEAAGNDDVKALHECIENGGDVNVKNDDKYVSTINRNAACDFYLNTACPYIK
jgi:hypothetical protein